VYQRWTEHDTDQGVHHGVVRDTDTDRETGATLWGINWDDGKTSDFTLADMQDFCVKRRDGNRASPPMVTAIEPDSTDSVRGRSACGVGRFCRSEGQVGLRVLVLQEKS
jgi:hypothetical protein